MRKAGKLLSFLNTFPFEPLTIHRVVDARRRLAQTFDPAFPLLLKFYSFPAYREMLGSNWLNWHEHLEMIVPLAGSGRFRSGDKVVDFNPGDLLLIDNLKLHGTLDLDGDHRSLVIFFMPELIYGAGSCRCDAAFLAPFWERPDTAEPVLRASSPRAVRVHEALIHLVTAYFGKGNPGDRQAACKVHFLEILLELRRYFELGQTTSSAGRDNAHQRRNVERLKKLFDFLNEHYSQKLSLGEAAAMVGMSETYFKNFFKRSTGTTFAQYVIRLRLNRASQMLHDTDLSMAEIAQLTGFCDQSHFDNRFKDTYHQSPKEYRIRQLKEHAAG